MNQTGRNDLQVCKVARDENNLYFYVQCREPITLTPGANGLYLLIDADQKHETGWEGFEFLVNRSAENRRQTWLEKHQGGWQWQRACPVRYRVAGRELQLAIPRADLGLPRDSSAVSIDFKWIDNLQHPDDIMDVYLSGDVAPEGRFKFRYRAGKRSRVGQTGKGVGSLFRAASWDTGNRVTEKDSRPLFPTVPNSIANRSL